MTYKQIFEWVTEHFEMNNYFSAEELLYDIKNEFNRTHSYFPIEAEDLVREQFQYKADYAMVQQRLAEQQQAADLLGNGKIMESLSDEILQDLRNPRAEIMGIDMTEYATTEESVIPPEIVRFAQRQTFFGRIASTFRRLLRFGR